MRRALILLPLLLLASSCVSEVGHFTVLSTRNVNRIDLQTDPAANQVRGSDGRFWLLIIPFGAAPSQEEAVIDALAQVSEADYLANVVVRRTAWTTILFGYEEYEVVGDAGIAPAGP